MSEDTTPEPTDIAAEFFAEEEPIESPQGDLASDFLKDVLADEPEPEPEPEKEPKAKEEEEEPKAKEEEEEKPEEDEEPPKGSSKKASEDWKKLRASRDRYKEEATKAVAEKDTQITELQTKVTEIEELRGKAAISAELEEKLKNYDELEKEVAILNVEKSNEYRKAVGEPLSAIEDQVVAISTENEGNLNDIFAAINEPDLAEQRAKLKEVTAGWDEIDKVELRNMAADARVLFGKQQEMREKASLAAKQREEMSAAEAEKAAAESKKAFQDASKSVVDILKDKLPFVPAREGETVEDRFAALAEKLKGVDFDSNNVKDKAFAAASALMLPVAAKTITHLQGELKALEERLAKQNSAKPGKSDPVEDADDEDEDFFEAMGIKTLDASQRLNVTL